MNATHLDHTFRSRIAMALLSCAAQLPLASAAAVQTGSYTLPVLGL